MQAFKYIIAGAGTITAAGAGQAADLPSRNVPVFAAPAAMSWAGFYVGVNAGVSWNAYSSRFSDYAGNPDIAKNKFGGIAGGQVGYNWVSGNILFGVEADLSKFIGGGIFVNKGLRGIRQKNDWLGTARGRVGIISGDMMAYVTGGVAFGGVKNKSDFSAPLPKSDSRTRVGWVVGAGVEKMLNANWTIGLEALYVDLGSRNVPLPANTTKTGRFSNSAAIARLKLNYKF